jgi:Polyketide cyclase / dehydrase and lipid transport
VLVVAMSSVEGVVPALSFGGGDSTAVTVRVNASPERVWQAVATATSPDFPLPPMLKVIPRPVAIVLDEGTGLGARRIVRFKGREGEGDLVLSVVRRTNEEVEYAALSDSSPIAQWVHHRALTFRVEPDGTGTRLTVGWHYDRLLAPAWFFQPMMRAAAGLATGVLARDTKGRAEAL